MLLILLFTIVTLSQYHDYTSQYDEPKEIEVDAQRLLILGGAGYMGQFALSQSLKYLKKGFYSHITIGDHDQVKGDELIEKHTNDDLSFVHIDVSNHEELVSLMKENDIIISTVGPFFKYGKMVVEAAIEAKKPLFDINDDLEPTIEIIEELDEKAKEREVPIYLGYGLSPGLTNFLTKAGIEEFDEDSKVNLDISFVTSSGDTSGYSTILHVLNLVQNSDYTSSSRQKIDYHEPIGDIEVMEFPHPETYTLKKYLPEKTNLGKVTVRGGIIPEWNQGLAFALTQLRILGYSLTDGYFASIWNNLKFIFELGGGERSAACRVDFSGKKDGEDHHLTYACGSVPMGQLAGYPVAIAAYLYVVGKLSVVQQYGILPPETQDPFVFFEEFSQNDVKVIIEDFGDYTPPEEHLIGIWNSKNIGIVMCVIPPIAMVISGCCGCIIGLVMFFYLRTKLVKKKND